MSVKSIVRFIIGIVLATLACMFLLPLVGVPRAQLVPPGVAYNNATGKAQGVISAKHTEPTSNPFRVGDRVYLVEYKFRAPYTPLLGGSQKSDPAQIYTGLMQVNDADYGKFSEGMTVPVRYDKFYPVISGVDLPEGARNGAQGSGIVSGCILWIVLYIFLGFLIAPWLERLILRESY